MLKVIHWLYQKNYYDVLILISVKNKTDVIKHIRFIFCLDKECKVIGVINKNYCTLFQKDMSVIYKEESKNHINLYIQ